MARAKESASPSTPQACVGSKSSASSEYPVPKASRKTRSLARSRVAGLSSMTAGCARWEMPAVATRRGPMPPTLMGTDALPGPPL